MEVTGRSSSTEGLKPHRLNDMPQVLWLGKVEAGTYTQGSRFQIQFAFHRLRTARGLLSSPCEQNILCKVSLGVSMSQSLTSFPQSKTFGDVVVPSSVLGLDVTVIQWNEGREGGDGDLSPVGT